MSQDKVTSLENSLKIKQTHFIEQSKKLCEERDEAKRLNTELEEKLELRGESIQETISAVNRKNLDQELEIDSLKNQIKDLKEVVFDLMLEKQGVNEAPAEYGAEVFDDLQQEFDEKKATKAPNPVEQKIKTLLQFANEQIKRQAEEIKLLKESLPQNLESVVEEENEQADRDENNEVDEVKNEQDE